MKKTISFLDLTSVHLPELMKQADRENLNHDKIIVTDVCLDNSLKNKIKIAWLLEPACINPNTYLFIKSKYAQFNYVLTHTKELMDQIPNAVFYAFGGTFIKPEDFKLFEKTKNISMVASSKSYCAGHLYRHRIRESVIGKVDIFGAGNPIEYKLDGLKDYRYSIAMENSKHDFYFTEKLVDCFLTGTVPIYWGCPGIGRFFNPHGMMNFETQEELHKFLEKASETDYNSRRAAIEENYNRAKTYVNTYDSVYNFVESLC